jgi:hypothetical protein
MNIGTIIVIGATIATIGLGLIYLINKLIKYSRKVEFKDWETGDKLILSRMSGEYDRLEKNGGDYAILEGWTTDNLYVKLGDNIIREISWSPLVSNKSAYWRRIYDKCKSDMGKEPSFTNKVGYKITISKHDIDLMNETECNAMLKKALEIEDYDTAELIRKRLENFR